MRILVSDIKKNMIIDEDVYTNFGSLILSKGLSVSDENYTIETLIKNNIKKIKVLILEEIPPEEKVDLEEKYIHYNSNVRRDVVFFIENFNSSVSKFQEEIIKNISSPHCKESLDELLEDVISSNSKRTVNVFQLLQKIKDYDDLTFVHCNSVSLVSYTIGKWLNFNDEDLKELSLAALLFDIGKHKICQDILNKKEILTSEEFEAVKQHISYSIEMLEPYNLSKNVIDAIKYHHERVDGSGYPEGLKGDEIPVMAKIIALADIFVALTSKRPYRKKYTPFEAIKILESEYMQKLDITILSEFIKKIASTYIGTFVKLSNNQEGEILFINLHSPLRPIIKLSPNGDLIDLSAKSNKDIDILEFI